MAEVEGSRTFRTSGGAYDAYMGRYSRALGPAFADFALPGAAARALDVGCGPGALTGALAERLGPDAVAAVDPSPEFVAACRERHPEVDVRHGAAEDLPYADDEFDAAAAQLVLHFVSDPDRAMAELARVVVPGGAVAAAVWDFDEGMQMLRAFWDAALSLNADAPDEARTLRFGRPGEIADLMVAAGLTDVEETTLTVSTRYAGLGELWHGLLAGIGPAGAYTVGLDDAHRARLHDALDARLGHPTGAFELTAVARAARGTVPG